MSGTTTITFDDEDLRTAREQRVTELRNRTLDSVNIHCILNATEYERQGIGLEEARMALFERAFPQVLEQYGF